MTLRSLAFLVLTDCAHLATPTPLPTERGWHLREASEAPATATPVLSGICGDSPQSGCAFLTWSATTTRVLGSALTRVCPTSAEVLPSPLLWLVHLGPGWGKKTHAALPTTGWRYGVRVGDPACLLFEGAQARLTLAVLDRPAQGAESIHLEPDIGWQRRGSVFTDGQRRFFRMSFFQPGLAGEVRRHALFDANGRLLCVLDEEPWRVLEESESGAIWQVQEPASSGEAPRLHLISR